VISWLAFMAMFAALPILGFAFAPRSFRRFCLALGLLWLGFATLFPHRGADNPLVMLDAIPLGIVLGAIAVEIVVLGRRLLAGRSSLV
jgi:hypothetical protein